MTSVTDRHAHREELCKRPSALVLPRPPARGPFTGLGYLNLVLRPWGESQGGNRATYSTDVPSRLLPVTLHGTWLYRPSSTGAERKLRVINSHTKQRQSGDAPLQAAQVDSRCRHQAGPLRAYLRCFECWSVLRPPPPPPPPTPARRRAPSARPAFCHTQPGPLSDQTPRPGSRPGSGCGRRRARRDAHRPAGQLPALCKLTRPAPGPSGHLTRLSV